MGSPNAFNKSGADQSSDSPTGWRIVSGGAMQMTLRLALASCRAAAFPAKPPPMTITSDEVDADVPDIGSASACDRFTPHRTPADENGPQVGTNPAIESLEDRNIFHGV